MTIPTPSKNTPVHTHGPPSNIPNNVASIRWDIDPYVNPYDGQDRNDTVGYVFPEGQGQYTLTAIGYVDATACASADSLVDVFTINVDRSYLVDVTASPVEDLYCEGDNGQFRGEVLVDSMGTFGTGYYSSAHYSELFWDYYSCEVSKISYSASAAFSFSRLALAFASTAFNPAKNSSPTEMPITVWLSGLP